MLNYRKLGHQVALIKRAQMVIPVPYPASPDAVAKHRHESKNQLGGLAAAGLGGALGATVGQPLVAKLMKKLPISDRAKKVIELLPGGHRMIGGALGATSGHLLGTLITRAIRGPYRSPEERAKRKALEAAGWEALNTPGWRSDRDQIARAVFERIMKERARSDEATG